MGSIGSYAPNKGNAKSALAQGRAARDAAYVNAANTVSYTHLDVYKSQAVY